MSQIIATVKRIENLDQLNIVEFEFQDITLKMMSLDLNANIQIGTKVVLIAKPTCIGLAKNLKGDISFSNQIIATIDNITQGTLLSSVILKRQGLLFESIITRSSANRMNLKKNDEICMLIKASDLSILELYYD